jgi:hypothetical protein
MKNFIGKMIRVGQLGMGTNEERAGLWEEREQAVLPLTSDLPNNNIKPPGDE